MTPQHVLILGGTGFVGHYLLPKLSAAGCRMTVLTRNREAHRELAVIPGVRLQNADVHDSESLARHLEGHDAVINLVGILNEDRRQSFQRVHVELTGKLISACEQAGVQRLVQMSALKAGQGLSQYLKSRGKGEALIKASKLNWTLLQASVMFGVGDGLVARFAGLLRLLPVFPLARPDARMAPVFVGDVAEAISRCLTDRSSYRKTLELFGAKVYRLIEIVRMIADAMHKRRWIIGLPDGLGRLQAVVGGVLPGKPFSTDNFLSLRTDSTGKNDGLLSLGIEAHDFATMLPDLLGHDNRARRYDAMRARHPQSHAVD